METISIKVEPRTGTGKKANKDLRKTGKIPAVMYGGDVNYTFSTTHNEVKHLVYTPNFKLASIEIDGVTHQAMVKDLQMHPVTDEIMHLDFIKLQPGVQIKVEVPVRFKGSSPGVKEGGKLIQTMRKVKIKTTPENIVDELYADISEVKLGEAIRVKDLEITDQIHVLSPAATPVAKVEVPRALKSATMAEEEEAAAAAGGEAEATEAAAPAE